MTGQPEGIAEGIYFNLSNEEYHNDPALSHSGMTKLLISWPDYWVSSVLNPKRAPWKQTDAMRFGAQSGMLLLQPEVFHQTYNTFHKAGGKANIKWQYLSSIDWQNLKDSVDAVMAVKAAQTLFKHGYAEVSIFWRDPATGVMLRVRVDWLLIFGCVDVKRIKGMDNWTIGNAIRDQGLDIQHFLYLEGVKAARRMLAGMSPLELGKFARVENVDRLWLEDFRDDADLLFRFLFQRSTPPYIWDFIDLKDDVVVEGANATLEAIRRYREGIDTFGITQPPLGRERVREIGSMFIPRRRYEFNE